MSDLLLEIEELYVEFRTATGSIIANQNINLDIHSGDCLAVVGESGSGKSTLGMTLLGLLPQNAFVKVKRLIFNNIAMTQMSEKSKREICARETGIVFQDANCLNPLLSIGKQLAEVINLRSRKNLGSIKKEVLKSLEEVCFPIERDPFKIYPHELSGGLAQRVMIAIALARNPKLIIADESTSSLDVTIQAEIVELFKELVAKKNLTIIFITHDIALASQFCNKIAVLYAGMLVEKGDIREILRNPMHPYTRGLLRAMPQNIAANKPFLAIPGKVEIVERLYKLCPFLSRCSEKIDHCIFEMPPRVHGPSREFLCWKK